MKGTEKTYCTCLSVTHNLQVLHHYHTCNCQITNISLLIYMYVYDLHTKFHMPKYNSSLVTALQLKAKENFCIPIIFLCYNATLHYSTSSTKDLYSATIYYQTTFHYPKAHGASTASTSEVCTSQAITDSRNLKHMVSRCPSTAKCTYQVL
jgi:hypothetical protein